MSRSQKQAVLLMEASKDIIILEETRKKRKIQIREVKLQWKDGVWDEKLDGTATDPCTCQSSIVVVAISSSLLNE